MKAPAFWRKPGSIAGAALSPLGRLYYVASLAHRAWARPWKAAVPVICVGNIVTGGAGKTPVSQSIGRILIGQGKKVHFLSRGYGGRLEGPVQVRPGVHGAMDVGDEPLLLAQIAPTWVSKDRKPGALAAIDAGAEVIVMDDGFQNPWIDKDLSLVVVDGGYGFGNGKILPAGPLREPVEAGLKRADAVLIIGTPKPGLLESVTSKGRKDLPILTAHVVPGAEKRTLENQQVFAFAGIARPGKFYETLEAIGCKIVGKREFPDHHPFTADEAKDMLEQASRHMAIPVTTEKDAVRLPRELHDKMHVLTISLAWDDPSALENLLAGVGRHGE